MKKCPNCHHILGDTDDFCPNDGTRLVGIFAGAPDSPTQVLQPPIPANFQAPAKRTSPLIYLMIGMLTTGFVAALIFIFAVSGRNNEAKNSAGTLTANNTSTSLTPVGEKNIASTPTPRPVDVDGTWVVTYRLKGGGDGHFDMRLRKSGGKLSVSTFDYSGSSAGEWYQRQGSMVSDAITFDVGEKQGYATIYSGSVETNSMHGTIATKNLETGKTTTGDGSWTAKRK